MKNFVKLNLVDGQEIHINMDFVSSIKPFGDEGTSIHMNNLNIYLVKESIEEIKNFLSSEKTYRVKLGSTTSF